MRAKNLMHNKYLYDTGVSVIFGLLSAFFGMVQFQVQTTERSYTDLREIPLLIAIFYLQSPLFILLMVFVSLLSVSADIPYTATYIFHIIPLAATFYLYRLIKSQSLTLIRLGISWGLVTLAYYFLMLLPLWYLTYRMSGIIQDQGFMEAYTGIVKTSLFEIITTTLVTSLFLVQGHARNALSEQNKLLETTVSQRTFELSKVNSDLQALNEELISSNEQIKLLNDSLEEKIKERTQKVEEQLTQLRQYAYMNSHNVRAPLARIMGITQLIRLEKSDDNKEMLLRNLELASVELDQIIRNMNTLLESELDDESTDRY